jgi:hypothetical protein
MQSNQTVNEQAEPKKDYSAPQLTEHGTIEDITGFIEDNSVSGPRPKA